MHKDHPHACGDKKDSIELSQPQAGSSPRVWGQEILGMGDKAEERIIPTRVGTSLFGLYHYGSGRDHPHACGDKFAAVASFHSNSGSSPRVWGQVLLCYLFGCVAGIIPTRVGTRLR